MAAAVSRKLARIPGQKKKGNDRARARCRERMPSIFRHAQNLRTSGGELRTSKVRIPGASGARVLSSDRLAHVTGCGRSVACAALFDFSGRLQYRIFFYCFPHLSPSWPRDRVRPGPALVLLGPVANNNSPYPCSLQ